MNAKMSRMTKALRAVQRELQGAKQSSDNAVESPQPLDISSIEKTSLFHGDQYSPHGNPLHSTALEEDLSPGPEQNQKSAPEKLGRLRARKPVLSVTDTTAVTQAKKIGKAVSDALSKKASSKENQEPPQPTNKGAKSVVRKVKGRPLPTISEGRDNAGKKRTSIPTSYRAKVRVQRNSSHKNETLCLNILTGFCRQTINSEAVKRSIDAVSRSFEEQLSEIITATKQLKNVKRENNKINSTINKKRTRLVEANNELIKGKTKLRILQKEHDEMEQRLKALREGSSLLTNLQELNRKYLKHHKAHPDEVETYGPSCMPAMLMEARCIMGTEHQLKTVNDHLQQVLDETENE
ncbi:centromere protein U [Sinocyclocheilus rhinocerous]|uniref:centromere protein U n=1 Tax=Sinocyclocheilus rhinocerous TaxID=307959 RepID=UPI0007BA5E9D|nr:PREDICTED: centromere protein U [Sinocyclocheilus rhinocerous]